MSAQVRGRLALAGAMAAAALVQLAGYWPGIMTWDAINQYGQATTGVYDDWHPPAMAWVWARLARVYPGPAPMLALQMILYWTGYAGIAAAARRPGTPGARAAAWGVAAVALMPFPLALMGSVLKDCAMQGLLLCAVALFLGGGPARTWASRLPAIACLVAAGLLRFNAFLATLPLLVALLPTAWRDGPVRLAAVGVAGAALLVAAMPLANRAIGADRSDVELSLMIFDLGGIGVRTGTDMFPPVGVADPVAVNRRCYSPEKWDNYSSWGHPPCPISFEKVDAWMSEHDHHAYPTILRAALAHPVAYAAHRLAHFNLNTRFLVGDEVQGAAPDRAIANEWGFTVDRGPLLRAVNALAAWSSHTPLGWPIVWIAAAAGLLGLCPRLPSAGSVAPIALSALLYGMGYLPFSVSSELRYNLWTITACAIGWALAAGDLRDGTPVSRRRLAAALAPACAVAAACAVARVVW